MMMIWMTFWRVLNIGLGIEDGRAINILLFMIPGLRYASKACQTPSLNDIKVTSAPAPVQLFWFCETLFWASRSFRLVSRKSGGGSIPNLALKSSTSVSSSFSQ